MKIRFLSGNQHKLDEASAILGPLGFEVIPIKFPIEELQTLDTEKLVRHKALEAFKKVGHQVFVEHTGLYLERLNGFPGGLTEIFWEKLKEDLFSELFGNVKNNRVIARTVVCYVDGQKFHVFEGEVSGRVAPEPAGPRGFQWDPVFIPDGYDKTFAELGQKKNEISMRKIALDRFARFLEETKANAD